MSLTKALILSSNNLKATIPNRQGYFSSGGAIPPNYTNSDAYLNSGWYHAVVFRIALGCSEVKWVLNDVSNREKPKIIYKHKILDTLHTVNPFQTSNEFIALNIIYWEQSGESFWAINKNGLSEPAEYVLPYPDKMSVVPAKDFPYVKGYVYGTGENAVPFEIDEIIHFKYPNPSNQYRGLGQAQAIGINLSAESNADKWVNQFFYNSARPDGVIQFDYNLSDEQFEKLKTQWNQKYQGTSKAHQVALLEGGGQYIQVQNTIKDMDFSNLKQKNRDVILGVFGMPQSEMGISENVNKANAEAGEYTFARRIVKPRLDWMCSKLNEQLLPKFKGSDNLVLSYEEVVPETIDQKRELAESGMRAGYLTINEARKLRGLDAITGDIGDCNLIPANLQAVNSEGEVILAAGAFGTPVDNTLTDTTGEPIGTVDTAENIVEGSKLNGVQITAALGVLRDLIAGNIPDKVALELLVAVGIDRDEAQAMISACAGFKPENIYVQPANPNETPVDNVSPDKGKPQKTIVEPKAKGLSPESKRAKWEEYSKKTQKQELTFQELTKEVFNDQKKQIIESIEKTGKLPNLDENEVAKKFLPAIKTVYESSFKDALE